MRCCLKENDSVRPSAALKRKPPTALLSLEATMLLRFGANDDWTFRGMMIGISGLVVSLILLSTSIYMIAHAARKIKQMGENENE